MPAKLPELSEGARALLAGRDSLHAYYLAQRPSHYRLFRHIDVILDHLEALDRGEFQNLAIFCPPQNGKSESASTIFPAWYMGRHPDRLVFVSAYSQELVNDFATQIRDFVQSEYHRAIFPACIVNERYNALHDFRTTLGGACRSAGRGGSITGRGAHLYIIDDPEKDQQEAQSEKVQRELRQWFNTVVLTRRRADAHVMMIKTRWDPEDLAGWELDKHASQWKVLELPALGRWEPDGTRIADEIDGEPLCPELYPRAWLEDMRERLPRDEWLALYQQKPTRDGDETVFSDEWFQTYDPRQDHADTRLMNGEIIIDPASKKKKKSDRTAMWVVGLAPDRNYYFIDGICDRLGLSEKWEALRELHRKWNPNFRRLRVWYEEFGLQADREYIDERQKIEGYRFFIDRIGNTQVSKQDLIRRFATGVCKDKRVYWNKEIWTMTEGKRVNLTRELFEQEWRRYPAVRHDDRLNAAAYCTDPKIGQSFPSAAQKGSIAEMYAARAKRLKGISSMGA